LLAVAAEVVVAEPEVVRVDTEHLLELLVVALQQKVH
jgi:hypothetical protein